MWSPNRAINGPVMVGVSASKFGLGCFKWNKEELQAQASVWNWVRPKASRESQRDYFHHLWNDHLQGSGSIQSKKSGLMFYQSCFWDVANVFPPFLVRGSRLAFCTALKMLFYPLWWRPHSLCLEGEEKWAIKGASWTSELDELQQDGGRGGCILTTQG